MNNFLQKSIFILLFFITAYANAQTSGSATGKVVNAKDKSAIDYASVAIKKLSDSSVVGGANTTATGNFTITGLTPGKYKLYVVFLGLKTITQEFELTSAKPSINFGNLAMEDTGVTLKSVEIKGEIPPVVVKKDTLEFNSSTIKVKENAVVEDGLKKLPGVDVAKDGTITAQGETVRRVKVDGKDFMGGTDPLLATKNLPWDMVDKIQIIDDLSEQSKFSGADDGNREKIINITTKSGFKNKGYFGNSTLGYGTDDRYDVNINANRFDKQQQFSLVGQFNNVNKQNFGNGGGGGGGGRMMFVGGGGGGQQRGITTTNAIGMNFSDVYDDQTQINGSYFFNKTSLFNTNNTFTQNFLGNTITTTLSDLNSTTDNKNHRFNFMIDTKLDSTTSIRVQPSISYTESSVNNVSNYTRNVLTASTLGLQRYQSSANTPSISNSILIRKKFQRRGRTLSLNINTNINNNDADIYNYILDNRTIGNVTTPILLDQLNDNNSNSINNTSRLVFTEPLSKTLSLELNYTNGYSFDDSERAVFNYNIATQQYDIKNLIYSNEFENTTLTNALGFSLNKTEKKYTWQIGAAVQNTDRDNVNKTNGDVLNQNFTNITPRAQFRYNFSNTKRLNIRYNGNTNQPSISQIQPIPDNTNSQSQLVGNPNLKPSFTNNLVVFYNNFDFTTYRTFLFYASINQTFNAFGNTRTLITDQNDQRFGQTINSFVNVDGNFNANAGGNLTLPFIKGNKLNFTISANGGYGKSTDITNSIENVTTDYSITNGYKLVSNLEKLDLVGGISGTMNRSIYSANANGDTRYYTIAPNFDISYLLPGNIRIQSDLTYNKVTGRGEGFNTDYTIVNGYVSRQFFKNKATFKLSVYDMLNQAEGVTRTSQNSQIIDQNFNVLKRYYMFSFVYSLNRVGANAAQGRQGQGGPGGMRMGGL
jgi:hypothetical protein